MLQWFKDLIFGLGEIILALPGMLVDVLNVIKTLVILIVNLIIMLVCGIVNLVVSILPNTPVDSDAIHNLVTPVLEPISYLVWLIPIKLILSTLAAWVGCVVLWFGGQIVLRYFKVIK